VTSTGRIEVMTEAEYRAFDALNFSWIKVFEESAAAAEDARNNPMKRTEAMEDGTLIHTATLEPDQLEFQVRVWAGGLTKAGKPTMNKNSSDYREFHARAEADGVLVREEWKLGWYKAIANSVLGHAEASKLIKDSCHEISFIWDHPLGVRCKSRLDIVGKSFLGDLKSTQNVGTKPFHREIETRMYHAQAAMYQDAVFYSTGERLPFAIIGVEKSRPYDTSVDWIDDALLGIGRLKYEGWIEQYLECERTGIYPGKCPTSRRVEGSEYLWREYAEQLETVLVDGKEVKVHA